jgi:CBS domain-containing protein/sporulation protein YlmC with PRC-barrel domain
MTDVQRVSGHGSTNGARAAAARASGEFVFLSDIVGRPVHTPAGKRLGRARDLVARTGEVYPLVEGLVVAMRGRDPGSFALVPWKVVGPMGPRGLELAEEGPFPALPAERSPREMHLAQDILDRQIVDTLGAKVVRVNDLHFLRAGNDMRLVHVDVGARGLVRRMGWQRPVDTLVRLMRPGARYLLKERFVSWKYVQPLSADPAALHLNIPQRQLSELHPADIAEIMEELDAQEREALFSKLDVETAADTLEEADAKLQRELIEAVAPERAADIVEEMSPDDAADLLKDLPAEQAQEILEEMEHEEAEDVKELLAYDPDTAGGLMTTDFVVLRAELTAAEALDWVRREASEKEAVYYLYVTDDAGALKGLVTLRDLVLAKAPQSVADLMAEHPVTVAPDEGLLEVATTAAKYNLLAVPVVDAKHQVLGIVTVDDLLDRVMQRA